MNDNAGKKWRGKGRRVGGNLEAESIIKSYF